MTITDKELNDLSYRKQYLVRQFEQKEISELVFNQKYSAITTEINDRIRQLLNEHERNKDKEVKEHREEKKMSEENVEQGTIEQGKKPGKQASESSYTGLIIKALKMDSLKSFDSVVEKVNEWKPGRDIKKIRVQATTIVSLVKKQNPARWKKYAWNEEEFLLTEKEE